MRIAALLAGLALAIGAAMALGGQAEPTPAPTPPVAEVVPRAKFIRAVSGWRREREHSTRLRAEIRRLRALPPSPFTEADTRIAARLVGLIGGWPVAGALRVAWCESHHQPDARNPVDLSGSHASGSWQVLYDAGGRRSSTWHSTDVGRAIDAPFNPYVNAFVAFRVWQRHGGSFVEWNDVCAGMG